MIDTIIFDVGRVLVNWDYESYLKRFAFGPEKTKAIAAATFESPYWRQFDRGILAPEEIVKGFCSLAPEYTEEINKIFFEVIIAPDYDVDALEILGQKKNRIILVRKPAALPKKQFRSLLNGVLVQDRDLKVETPEELKTVTTKAPTAQEIEDMLFANKIVKNSKSNAIVLAKGKQLLASGVGQTSRVDALKQAIEKAKNYGFDLNGAVMASDAFFPFPDCVEIAGNEGVTAVIQPGGSIKDELSFEYCNEHGIAMVTTGFRHFKH